MERNPLNFFQPYERLAANHENQLTRALLLVLRLSPMAHECWLARVEMERKRNPDVPPTKWRLPDLPPAQFKTQVRDLREQQPQDPDEGISLVSVFLTPETPLGEDTAPNPSERTRVLDAVIEYPGERVVVIENKVADAPDEQAPEHQRRRRGSADR